MSDTCLEKPDYLAFISYRHADNREADRCWATWLHRSLERYVVPPDLVGTTNLRGDPVPPKIFPVFRDEEEFSAEASLAPAIRSALERSKTLIVLSSPRAVESPYVAEEIRHFKSLGRSDRIVPALLDGEPNEAFPEPLLIQTADDGTVQSDDVEPLAADFRLADATEGYTSSSAYLRHLKADPTISSAERNERIAAYREKSNLAFLKLVAAVLAVPLATLTRRDQAHQLRLARKRARIFRGVAAALSILLAIAVITGLYANRKRIEATKARDSANQLVGFMLHDLYDQLSETGRLDVLSSAVEKVDSHLLENPTPPRLVADLRLQQAKILFGQGRLDEAAERAMQTLDALPEDPSTRIGRAKLHAFLGDILAWGQNRNTEARDECMKALGLFDSSTADLDALEALVRTQIALGDILRDDWEIKSALQAYDTAWDLAESAAPTLDTIAALARQRKAEVCHLTNDPVNAAKSVSDVMKLAESHLAESPNSHPWLVIKAQTLSLRSVIERHAGLLSKSLESLRTAETFAEQTATPGQLHRQFLLAKIRGQIANHPSPTLTLPQRSELFVNALDVQRSLLREDPANRGWAGKLASTLRDHAGFNLGLAELFKDPSFHKKAVSDLEEAELLLRPIDLPSTLNERVETLLMLGGLSSSTEETAARYSEARELQRQMPTDDVEAILLDAMLTQAEAKTHGSQRTAHEKILRAWNKAEGIRKRAITLQLAASHGNLASAAATRKDADQFFKESDRAAELLSSLLIPETKQPDLQENIALALNLRAKDLRVLGLNSEAGECYREAAGIFENLSVEYPVFASPLRELALAQYQLGKLAAAEDAGEKSMELLGTAFSTYLEFLNRVSLENKQPPSPLGLANIAALNAIVGRESESAIAMKRYDVAASAWSKLYNITKEIDTARLPLPESTRLEEIRYNALEGAVKAYSRIENASPEQISNSIRFSAEFGKASNQETDR
ncbi:MAG: TIR domain-containing protein [Luteolibacter sp.]